MNDLPVTLDQLTARLELLEQRVDHLEHPAAAVTKSAVPSAHPSSAGQSTVQATGLFTILGSAMLGIAGAYVLRAVAESAAVPRILVAGVAIAYALMWMVWATRVKTGSLPSIVYAGTSALILAPMLWELTLSFGLLSPSAAAATLAVFLLASAALAWQRNLSAVFWIANLAVAIAALALSIATRQFIPFVAVLLLMVLVAEVASVRKRAGSVRLFVAAAADVTVWVYFFIYSGDPSARTDYPALHAPFLIVPACLLFVLYAVSIAIRTVILQDSVSVFEILQSAASFALAAFSLVSFAPQSGSMLLGSACLFLAVACYGMVFTVARGTDSGRNQQVFGAFATAFLIIGGLLCLPTLALALTLSIAAVAVTILGVRINRASVQVHGLLLLVTASIASGLLDYDFHSLAGTLPDTVSVAACIVAVCALVCYAGSRPVQGESHFRQFLRVIPAALAACTLTALLLKMLLALVALRFMPGVHHVAFVRTFSICAVALGLAYAGVRTHRPELTQITYGALVFVAAKLIFEDLRHGHFEFIAASIFLFAISLMIVPRLSRVGQTI